MKAYLISGLGADERAFEKIVLPAQFEPVFIKWIHPGKQETLQQYAMRLCNDQMDVTRPFVLIGLSFGGMLASEIARIHVPAKLVLISSVSENRELPWLYRITGRLRLDRFIPYTLTKKLNGLFNILFGPLNKDTSHLLKKIIERTDTHFLKWAVGAILTWKTVLFTGSCLKLHGSRDKILRLPDNGKRKIIEGAGHLAVYTHADEINPLLRNYLLS